MEQLRLVAMVAMGGALGAACRYVVTYLCAVSFNTHIPYGTLIVNGVGCFFVGLLSYLLFAQGANPNLAAFLITGFLGGLTAFSAMMNETMQFISAGHMLFAVGYLAVQMGVGLVLALVGGGLGHMLAVWI